MAASLAQLTCHVADARINNAGIALNGFDADVVQKTFALNYHHVTDFNERVLAILRPGGRIVVLASMTGALNGYSPSIVERFRSVASRAAADDMALEYQRAARESIGTLKQAGWKEAAYSVSKVRRTKAGPAFMANSSLAPPTRPASLPTRGGKQQTCARQAWWTGQSTAVAQATSTRTCGLQGMTAAGAATDPPATSP